MKFLVVPWFQSQISFRSLYMQYNVARKPNFQNVIHFRDVKVIAIFYHFEIYLSRMVNAILF